MKKGLEMTTVNIVILAVAIAVLALLVWKLVPTFGSFVTNSLKAIKVSLCKMMGGLIGC